MLLHGKLDQGLVRRLTLAFLSTNKKFRSGVPQPGADPSFSGGDEDLRQRRVSGEALLWRPRWIERRNVEEFDPVEDFDIGSAAGLQMGFSSRLMGATADEGYVRARLELGADAHQFGFGTLRTNVESRVRAGPRELLGRVEGRWVQQPLASTTFVLAASGVATKNPLRDYQVIVGGLNGLRAFPVQALAGTQAWRLNAESRWLVARGLWDLVSVGGTAFTDAARTWGRGSDGAPWHLDAGVGLRLSLPHSSLHHLARIDVAWPLSPTRDGRRSPVFSFGSAQAF